MRVISKARLREFWRVPGHADAERPLRAWYARVNHKSTRWHTWADVKADFSSASLVGNCIVFNIHGNKYRLVTRILFRSQKVFVLRVMTHADYDKEPWPEDCGCFNPPPSPQRNGRPRR